MPRKFYDDTNRDDSLPDEELCLDEVEMWDGPGVCMRRKGHEVDESKEAHSNPESELHQEAFEGWTWNAVGIS
ncbi:hypothetical protein GCM10018783_74060 [Streptomyces griseosporeus]|nr:hypothetical protein GCM10018783_74060 [Streptomyces griseosporeus]